MKSHEIPIFLGELPTFSRRHRSVCSLCSPPLAPLPGSPTPPPRCWAGSCSPRERVIKRGKMVELNGESMGKSKMNRPDTKAMFLGGYLQNVDHSFTIHSCEPLSLRHFLEGPMWQQLSSAPRLRESAGARRCWWLPHCWPTSTHLSIDPDHSEVPGAGPWQHAPASDASGRSSNRWTVYWAGNRTNTTNYSTPRLRWYGFGVHT